MSNGSKVTSMLGSALRSINAFSGAGAGAAAAAGYIFGGMATEMSFGRSSPDKMAGTIIFALPILTVIGVVVVGTCIGLIVSSVVSRSRYAGAGSRRARATGVAVALVLGGLAGSTAAQRFEARSRPRVIETSGAVQQLRGASALRPLTAASPVYYREAADSLVWRGRRTWIAVDNDVLVIDDSSGTVDRVTLKGLDYVMGVDGAIGRAVLGTWYRGSSTLRRS